MRCAEQCPEPAEALSKQAALVSILQKQPRMGGSIVKENVCKSDSPKAGDTISHFLDTECTKTLSCVC